MSDPRSLETRVGRLIAAYADRAPIDVDPVTMARWAAAGSARPRPLASAWPPGGRLAFIFLVVALLVAIVAATLAVGAGLRPRGPEDLLTERAYVAPFVGLPPDDVAPSSPQTGQLVVAFGGRVRAFGLDFHRMWLYADGRLIWKSNLEGSSGLQGDTRFGQVAPTTALIEQRLTPEGVDLVLAEVLASAEIKGVVGPNEDRTAWHRPGVLWGQLTLGDGSALHAASWGDPRLPARLADPAAWLPASAWADRSPRGFVPGRYAVCVEPIVSASPFDALPRTTQELIRSRATPTADPRCGYEVSTDDARAIAGSLDRAGLQNTPYLRWSAGSDDHPAIGWFVELLPITPSGEYVCNCG